MVAAGMNIARFNFSHGSHQEHGARMQNVRKVSAQLGVAVPIMLDTKGPEIRLRTFEGGQAMLEDGATFVLTTVDKVGNSQLGSVTYANLPKVVKKGDTILIGDGMVHLEVRSIQATDVTCTVIHGGRLFNKKAINLPGIDVDMPYLSDIDIGDIEFGISQNADYIALSFVREAADVAQVRAILAKHNASHIKLIAKVENRQGVNNLHEIIEASDGVMVARGDMGVEIDFWELPAIQKRMVKACNLKGKFCIVATQMLESMIGSPRPTRAEVTDVANAVWDGADATMLSGESAAGKFALKTVQAMVKIIVAAEAAKL
jgi:pyruvate kinase